jgi:hypothetical protein
LKSEEKDCVPKELNDLNSLSGYDPEEDLLDWILRVLNQRTGDIRMDKGKFIYSRSIPQEVEFIF